MKTFTERLPLGNLEIGLIITTMDEERRQFKVVRMTGEKDPVVLTRSGKKSWLVDNPGKWDIPESALKKLGRMIDARFEKIAHMQVLLVLTDFSETAANAARYAAGLTRQLQVFRLVLYHSYEFNPIALNVTALATEGVVDTAGKSHAELETLKEQLQAVVSKQTLIETYADELAIAPGVKNMTENGAAGLVVVGITGKSNLKQLLIGSHTLDLAKTCHAPLLIVPGSARFEKIRRIAFACDLKLSPAAIPVAAIKTILHDLNAQLVILNIGRDRHYFDQDKIAGQSALNDQWNGEKPEYHYITHKDVADGIMQFADRQDIQLVITIPQKYGFFESLFHRSVTKKLAFHTHIPLLLLNEAI